MRPLAIHFIIPYTIPSLSVLMACGSGETSATGPRPSPQELTERVDGGATSQSPQERVDGGPINDTRDAGKLCGAETKQCPDGSTVSRGGANCDFAPCPSQECLAVVTICPDGRKAVPTGPNCEVTCSTSQLTWHTMCGQLACSSPFNPDAPPVVKVCEAEGSPCTTKEGTTCSCGTVMICDDHDPKANGCAD